MKFETGSVLVFEFCLIFSSVCEVVREDGGSSKRTQMDSEINERLGDGQGLCKRVPGCRVFAGVDGGSA